MMTILVLTPGKWLFLGLELVSDFALRMDGVMIMMIPPSRLTEIHTLDMHLSSEKWLSGVPELYESFLGMSR